MDAGLARLGWSVYGCEVVVLVWRWCWCGQVGVDAAVEWLGQCDHGIGVAVSM